MKTCIICEASKTKEEFYNMKAAGDGKDPYCITCRKEVSRKYNKNNRKKLNEYQNAYYARNKEAINSRIKAKAARDKAGDNKV